MTFDEFIVALENTPRLTSGWALVPRAPSARSPYLRVRSASNCCPIEYVAGTGPNAVHKGVHRLELSCVDADRIIIAADYCSALSGSETPDRRRLLAAVGLGANS